MMKSYPFDSKNTGSDSTPQWDRAITAEDERMFNKLYFTNGVFANPADSLMVTPASGMQIKVSPGGCHIEGAKAFNTSDRYITLGNSDSSLSRIDRIVARFDTSESVRSIDIYVREGVPSTAPVAQELHRDSNYYEIALADVLIVKRSTSISSSHITDQRLNPELCGFVVPMAKDYDTSVLWDQIKDSINLVNEALNGTVISGLKSELESEFGGKYAPKNSPTLTGSVNIQGSCEFGGLAQYKYLSNEPSLSDNSGKLISSRWLNSKLKDGVTIKNVDFTLTDYEYNQLMQMLG